MATPFAIAAPADRALVPPTSAARAAADDAMAGRPPIPRGVVHWPDPLPAGAGDPAVAIDGPPPFAPWHSAEVRAAPQRPRLDTLLFGAVVAAILGAVSLTAIDAVRTASVIAASADPALLGRVPVVETRILSMEPVIDTAARTIPASAAHGG